MFLMQNVPRMPFINETIYFSLRGLELPTIAFH